MVEVNAMKIDHNCRMNAPLYSRHDVIEDICISTIDYRLNMNNSVSIFTFVFLKKN